MNDEDNAIIKVDFGWEIPEPLLESFKQSSEYNRIIQQLKYQFEDLSRSFLQIFPTLNDLRKTIQYKKKLAQSNGDSLFKQEHVEKITDWMVKMTVLPPRLPKKGLKLDFEVIVTNPKEQNSLHMDEFSYLDNICENIEMIINKPKKSFTLVFHALEAYAKYFILLRPEFSKSLIK